MPSHEPERPPAPRREPTREGEPLRPQKDRLYTGQLIEHGASPHEFHPKGPPSYYVTLKRDGQVRTIWGRGLERAFAESRTKPKLDDLVGIRENNLDPVSVVLRERKDGVVVATRQLDSPRPHWVVEKLEEFDRRTFAAQALRDPTISRREAVISHRELSPFYWVLDALKKVGDTKIKDPERREVFMRLSREALALAYERGEPAPIPPGVRQGAPVAAESPERGHSAPGATRTRE